MGLYSISDKIVFKILRDIEYGYLEITKYSGETLKFGNSSSSLKAVLKIKKPNFTFNLINSYFCSFIILSYTVGFISGISPDLIVFGRFIEYIVFVIFFSNSKIWLSVRF